MCYNECKISLFQYDSYKGAFPMDKPDIATVIDSHFEEMTDLEQEIARYFCKLKRLQMIYLPNRSLKNYISLKLLWPALLKSVALLATENLFSNTNITQKTGHSFSQT